MPARVRIVGHTFEHQSRCSVRKRSVDDVAVACNPSDIRRAPVNIAVVIVENVLMGHGGVNEITARRMQHALRLSSRARRIKYEQWVFRAHRLGRAIGRSVRHCLVIPNVTTVDPIDVATSPFDHNDCLNLVTQFGGGVRIRFKGDRTATAQTFVGCYDDIRFTIVDAPSERIR